MPAEKPVGEERREAMDFQFYPRYAEQAEVLRSIDRDLSILSEICTLAGLEPLRRLSRQELSILSEICIERVRTEAMILGDTILSILSEICCALQPFYGRPEFIYLSILSEICACTTRPRHPRREHFQFYPRYAV